MRTMDHQMDHDFDDERDRDRGWDTDREMDRGIGRGSYRSREADTTPPAPEPRDLTLGLTALLGIFFAAVLVCAVFFGFGYSTGRTLHGARPTPSPSAPAGTQANDASDTDTAPAHSTPAPALVSAQPLAKPSAGAPSTSIGDSATPARDAADEPQGFPDDAPTRRASLASAPGHAEPLRPLPRLVSAAAAPPQATGGMMVQIAAVARQGDADMLAQALRANGFAAVVRTEPQDKFLHVQVGPFATRDQAKAMRARLEADGYNAFLKP